MEQKYVFLRYDNRQKLDPFLHKNVTLFWICFASASTRRRTKRHFRRETNSVSRAVIPRPLVRRIFAVLAHFAARQERIRQCGSGFRRDIASVRRRILVLNRCDAEIAARAGIKRRRKRVEFRHLNRRRQNLSG